MVAIRIVVHNEPKFIALPLGTHELTFDLLISKGVDRGQEGSTGASRVGDMVAGFGKGIWGREGSFTEFQDYVQPGVVLAYLMWRS